jgi:hypothetical protein
MNRKIPSDAFNYYVALGPGRSYQAVAEQYGVSKRGVALYAKRENWQARLAEQERKAREAADQKALETLEAMNDRHLKTTKFLQSKGIEALKGLAIDNATAAVRAVIAGLEKERLIRGEPTERTENIEALYRRDQNLLTSSEEDEYTEDEGQAEAETVAGSEVSDEDEDQAEAGEDDPRGAESDETAAPE